MVQGHQTEQVFSRLAPVMVLDVPARIIGAMLRPKPAVLMAPARVNTRMLPCSKKAVGPVPCPAERQR